MSMTDVEKQYSLTRWATYASVTVAVTLALLKVYAWWVTDSVSILASLVDSGMDLLASLIILFGVMIAQLPADNEHRLGHGKAEPLAVLAQSVFITASALFLILYSIDRLIDPKPLQQLEVGMSVILASLVLTLILNGFQRYVVKKTGSTAIESDALHYLSDILSNIAILLGLWLSLQGFQSVDAWLGLAIGGWILYSAVELLRKALDQLLDRQLPESEQQKISQIVNSHPEVAGFNDLRAYRSGPTTFIQLDLELEDTLSLVEAHRITEEVTQALKEAFAPADVIIHQEPKSIRADKAHHQWLE
jgi:ferrous-iron efflux pump FieF